MFVIPVVEYSLIIIGKFLLLNVKNKKSGNGDGDGGGGDGIVTLGNPVGWLGKKRDVCSCGFS